MKRAGIFAGLLFWATCEVISAVFAIIGICAVVRGDSKPVVLIFALPILLISVRAILEESND